MDLSIVIVNWNTRDLLNRCLQSVYSTAGSLKLEVIVVDNASSDGSAAFVRYKFPQVLLIESPVNAGFARASNRGLVQSKGCYVLLLNSDTEIHVDALQTMIDFLDAHPQVGACGPRLLNSDGSLQPSCHPMLTPWREFWRLTFLDQVHRLATYDMASWETDMPREVDVIKGACLMVRREALHEVELLDERYFMYSEEMDLCRRLQEMAWRLYWLPHAEVVHHGEGSTRQMAEEMYVQLYRSKVLFHRKFGGDRKARLFKLLLALAYAPRWAVATLGGRLAPGFDARARTYRRLLAELLAM